MKESAALCAVVLVIIMFAARVSPPAETGATGIQAATLAAGGSADPFVGVDDAGTALAVWPAGAGESLEYASREPGGELGPVRTVLGVGRAEEVLFDQAASGAAVVAWVDSQHDGRVMAAVRPRSGAGFGAAQPVSAPMVRATVSDLDVAISETGRVAAVWVESDDGSERLRRALSDVDGRFPG